jgi:VWFA-related protein
VDVNSVLLNVSVRDRYSNRSITGLEWGDFRVYEDGVLQQLQQTDVTAAPYSLLLLMDVSGSTYSYMKLMKRAATEFTNEIGENDRIAIASFNSKVRLALDFTSNHNAARKAISHLSSGGGTAFYDALMTCVDQYMRNVEGRKAIVVFTDGVDNILQGNPKEGSRTSYEQLCDRLQETDTIVYTIFLNSEGKEIMPSSGPEGGRGGSRPKIGRFPLPLPPAQSRFPFPLPLPIPSRIPTPGPGIRSRPRPEGDSHEAYLTAREQLEAIAELTGGRMYSPQHPEELSRVYAEIADDLRIQYLLSYASSNTAKQDGWRSIQVEVNDHSEAVVRTRRGYALNRHHE